MQQAQATVTSAQTQSPTCTENGETTYTATFTVAWATEQPQTAADIAALGHKLVGTLAKEAICAGKGNIAGLSTLAPGFSAMKLLQRKSNLRIQCLKQRDIITRTADARPAARLTVDFSL